nr:hypothetical protein [Bacteroidota bacterium]
MFWFIHTKGTVLYFVIIVLQLQKQQATIIPNHSDFFKKVFYKIKQKLITHYTVKGELQGCNISMAYDGNIGTGEFSTCQKK